MKLWSESFEIPAQQSIDLFALNTLQECFHSRGVPQVPPNLPGKVMGFSTIVTDFWQNPSSQAFVPVPVMPVGQTYGFLRWASLDVYRLLSSKGIGVVVLNQRF